MRSYNSPANPPSSPIDVERITAAEYLDAAAKAERNGDDKPALRRILTELERFPNIRQRLAFEMLPMFLRSLKAGTEPPHYLVSFVTLSANSIDLQRLPEFAAGLEKIILQFFDLAGARPAARQPSTLTILSSALTLHQVDKERFVSVFAELKRRCGAAENDPRREFITHIEWVMTEAQKKSP